MKAYVVYNFTTKTMDGIASAAYTFKNEKPTIDEILDATEQIKNNGNYDCGKTWRYSVDFGTPYGSYIDDFWNTSNDWKEGQLVEVVGYAELPYYLNEEDLIESEEAIFHECR